MKFLLHPGRLLHPVPLIDTTEHRFEIVCNSSILYVNFQQVFKDSRYSVDPYVKGKAQIFYSNIKLKCLIAFYLVHQIQQPIPKLGIRIFTNCINNKNWITHLVYLLLFLSLSTKTIWNVRNHSLGIGCWIQWVLNRFLPFHTSNMSWIK